ncbi:MAG: hypothetical protein ACRDEB_02665 [Chitinophagaceae bacterium]
MRKLLLVLMIALFGFTSSYSQTVPSGMKYQAVARNTAGEILPNRSIILKIDLKGDPSKSFEVFYSEEHAVITNQFGLFDLVVGEGKAIKGLFAAVPWSTRDIWLGVSLKDKGADFVAVTESRLLAVPYAFHAGTATKLADEATKGPDVPGVPANVWSLQGNYNSDPTKDKLGTTDYQDLVMVTNNLERLRITKDGDISINNSLKVGVNVEVGNDLFVKKNVFLNTVSGATTNNGSFTVANMSPTLLTGTLTVNKVTNITDATESTLTTNGALIVAGGVGIGKRLNVGGMTKIYDATGSTSTTTGALVVTGGVGIGENLNVSGIMNINGPSTPNTPVFNVMDNNTGYLATFINTSNGNDGNAGDGIKIQLGKEKPLDLGGFQLPTYGTFLPGITGAISNSIFTNGAFNTSITASQFFSNLYNGATSDVLGYVNMVSAGLCNLTNKILEQINTILPIATPNIHIWNEIVLFGGLDLGALGSIPRLAIPELNIPPQTLVPEIPLLNCPPFTNPFNWNLTFPTVSSTPLTKNNEFIGFFDKNGAKVGAIRGQSLQDFIENYTDIPHLVSVAATFVNAFDLDFGTPDPFAIVKMGAKALDYFVNTWDVVGKIGVEYSSGSGDYAEWLERQNPDEIIGTGDIIAVKGGKITKDILGAEQIMAVSHHPIVLGNIPDKDKIAMGNNIAFMGQIPVKVMGPVTAGDFIVAKSDVPGYGVAVSPVNMKVEDYKLTVGRSWTTNEKDGPKMVNTVVGVHNNNFLDLIRDLKEKADENDARLKAIEAKLNIPTPDTQKVKNKKAF